MLFVRVMPLGSSCARRYSCPRLGDRLIHAAARRRRLDRKLKWIKRVELTILTDFALWVSGRREVGDVDGLQSCAPAKFTSSMCALGSVLGKPAPPPIIIVTLPSLSPSCTSLLREDTIFPTVKRQDNVELRHYGIMVLGPKTASKN